MLGKASALLFLTGCTIVSGWSDLQGGAPPAPTTKPSNEAGAPDATPTADASTPHSVTCGDAACASPNICCAMNDKLACTAKGACVGVEATCTTRADCDGANVCCFDGDFSSTSCTTSCDADFAELVLCATSDKAACGVGQTCVPISTARPNGLHRCK